MSPDNVAVLLGIPGERVLKTEPNAHGELIVTIESTKLGTNCRGCGRWISKLHGQED